MEPKLYCSQITYPQGGGVGFVSLAIKELSFGNMRAAIDLTPALIAHAEYVQEIIKPELERLEALRSEERARQAGYASIPTEQ